LLLYILLHILYILYILLLLLLILLPLYILYILLLPPLGRSKYTCIYAVATGNLLKKYQLSHNRSLEGVLDELRSDRLVDGISLDRDEDGEKTFKSLPGGQNSGLNDGSRTVRPEIIASAVGFSPTGREWGVVTTQGLQIFSLDENMLFAPSDITVAITPQAVAAAISRDEYSVGVNMALHLGEAGVIKRAVDAVPMGGIEFVVRTIDARLLRGLLSFIAGEIVSYSVLLYAVIYYILYIMHCILYTIYYMLYKDVLFVVLYTVYVYCLYTVIYCIRMCIVYILLY
ncbi:hypothetical protein B484DRAFT_288410, partial [Ochromonadaceae sp. CCMP2298]